MGNAGGGAYDEVARALQAGQVAQLGDNNGPYRCNVCNKELKTKSTLKNHFTSQTHQNKISSARPASPQHHGQQIPATKTPQQVCSATGWADDEGAKALRAGQVTQLGDNNGPYRCNVCNKELKTKSTLMRHFTSQTHQNKISSARPASPQHHGQQIPATKTPQQVGDATGGADDEVAKALRVGQVAQLGDNNGPYRCNVCNKELKTKSTLKRHFTSQTHQNKISSARPASPQHHGQQIPATKTPQQVGDATGGADDEVAKALRVGQVAQLGDNNGPYRCNVCNKELKTKSTLKRHFTSQTHQNKISSARPASPQHHGQQIPATKTPQQVGDATGGADDEVAKALRVGQVAQLGDNNGPYRCNVCNKELKTKSTLKRHFTSQTHQNKMKWEEEDSSQEDNSQEDDSQEDNSQEDEDSEEEDDDDDQEYNDEEDEDEEEGITRHVLRDNHKSRVCGASGGADDEVEKALRVGQVAQLGDNNGPYRCNVCNKELKTKSTLKRHFTSQTHQNKIVHFGDLMKWKDDADQEEESDNNEEIIAETDDKSKLYMCIPCNRSVKRWDLGRHLESETHKAKIGTVEGMETKLHDTVKKTVSRGAAAGTQPVSPGNDRPQAVSRGTAAGTQHVSPGNDRPDVNTGVTYERIVKIMATSKDIISRETLFSHELAPYPTALFDEGGEMRHTSKSVLKNRLLVPGDLRAKLTPEVIILDGSALLWAVPWPVSQATVSTYISTVVKNIIRRGERAPVLHVVFDRYYDISPKTCCRKARQKRYAPVYNFSEESLQSDQVVDKKRIISLIVKQLCSIQVPRGKQVIVTGPDAHPIQVGIGPQQTAVTHEEADVIMAYHMLQEAAAGHSPIRIVCDDTDVFLILAHHLHARTNNIPHTVQVSMESCTRGHAVVSINEVVKKHSSIIPNILAAHALTGCDTVSSFAGIGKITALKTLEAFPGSLDLGNPSASLDEVTDVSLKYVSALYNQTPGDSLNNMRATIFTKQISNNKLRFPRLSRLPPTMAAFRPHCGRAHYQTALWKSAGMPSQPPLDPLQYGWEMNGSTLTPVYSLPGQSIVPDEVYNLVNCSCKTACTATLCSCYKFTLPCTKLCTCKGHAACLNPETEKRRM
ncbi:zinc finger protein Xfin-like isoform X2 [Homarus americanus]|nr:zinc finger protein Xfin-like isoform X2 [Homarus americanus]